MDELLQFISTMTPEEALPQITRALERLLGDLDQDARKRFLMNLLDQSEEDKVSSMVHL